MTNEEKLEGGGGAVKREKRREKRVEKQEGGCEGGMKEKRTKGWGLSNKGCSSECKGSPRGEGVGKSHSSDTSDAKGQGCETEGQRTEGDEYGCLEMEVLRLNSKTLKLELLDVRTGRRGKREGSEGDNWVCGWANVGCSRDRSEPLLLHAPVYLPIQPSS